MVDLELHPAPSWDSIEENDDSAFDVVLPPEGIVLVQELAGGDKEERCFIYRKADDGSQRHGAAEVRRRARVDGYVQDGGVVWRRAVVARWQAWQGRRVSTCSGDGLMEDDGGGL